MLEARGHWGQNKMAWDGSGKDRSWKWHRQATLHAARKQVAIVVEEEERRRKRGQHALGLVKGLKLLKRKRFVLVMTALPR